MALYDGKDAPFRAAIPRSIQRSPMFTVKEHSARNAALATQLNCTSSEIQLACLRNVSASDFVNAALSVTAERTNGYVLRTCRSEWLLMLLHSVATYGGFLPTIDGKTLTDTITKLFQNGKIAKVPTLAR